MGLYVQSLDSLPADQHRSYYVYLLDYGWDKPLGEALFTNLGRMAGIAEETNSVVIHSGNRVHFADQVLSWHNVNGEDAKEMLPAILITNRNPHQFKESRLENVGGQVEKDLKMIFIPLDKFCRTPTDVTKLIERLFNDIKAGKELSEFRIGRKIRKGGKALADALVLAPINDGKSISMPEVINFLKGVSVEASRAGIQKMVHPIHFEDFGGEQFEWLAYAFVERQMQWNTLEWLGQTGADGGRDIWGTFNGKSYCYQCANYQKLTTKKIKDDIDKLIREKRKPDHFIVVCGGTATPSIREQIASYSVSKGIEHIEIWSGREFEEKVRHYSPDLIKRFVEGEEFPESPNQAPGKEDEEIIRQLFECFDRPAFTTGFKEEASIPDFEKAITDTIEVLNTGMHRLRDGLLVRRISSRHEVADATLKSKFNLLSQQVVTLRNSLVRLKKEKEIRSCACDEPNCPVWFFSNKAAEEMDNRRKAIFKQLKAINPNFVLKFN